jgi:hypothetical protein
VCQLQLLQGSLGRGSSRACRPETDTCHKINSTKSVTQLPQREGSRTRSQSVTLSSMDCGLCQPAFERARLVRAVKAVRLPIQRGGYGTKTLLGMRRARSLRPGKALGVQAGQLPPTASSRCRARLWGSCGMQIPCRSPSQA